LDDLPIKMVIFIDFPSLYIQSFQSAWGPTGPCTYCIPERSPKAVLKPKLASGWQAAEVG